jgi:flavin-dependent dehydrogenase
VTVDVVVVGGGPAGCAAAARSALDGATVTVVHRPRRDERPSESLPAAAARVMRAAGLGTVDDVAQGRCGGTLSAWGTAHLAVNDSFASPEGAGWWVDRARFDAALRDRCASLGVAVLPRRAKAVWRDNHCWIVDFAGGGQIRAGWVIDATGRAGALTRRLGASRRAGPGLLAVHARTKEASETTPSRVLLETGPHGWWYVGTSSNRQIGACAVVQPSLARLLLSTEHFAKSLNHTSHLGCWARGHQFSAPRTSWASSSALDRVSGAGWVACGDAAMALDPISGQGLLGALAGGLAAAQAICSSDTARQMRQIAARHAEVLRIYELRRSAAYRSEQRWPQHPFWSTQHSCHNLG